MKISKVIDLKPNLGEGPIWDVKNQELWCIDSQDGRLFRHHEDTSNLRVWDVREKIGSMALYQDGKSVLLALQTGLYKYNLEADKAELISDPEPEYPKNRLNDGKVDFRGRFVFGSMDTMEEAPTGRLYSYEEGKELRVLDEGIICSNGPCWSPDGSIFYFADTWTGDIWAYDYDLETGDVSNRRVFATVDQSDGGACDGMTVDAEGCVWQAHGYAGKLNRYDPDGKLERQIEMPVKKVTCPVFGGANLARLVVTTMARPPLPRFPEDGAARGTLYVIDDLGIKGYETPRFGK